MTHMMKTAITSTELTSTDQQSTVANPCMFFRRWIANPLQMGSVVPSSSALCRLVAAQVRRAEGEIVVELGAGTVVCGIPLVLLALTDPGAPAYGATRHHRTPDFEAPLQMDKSFLFLFCKKESASF